MRRPFFDVAAEEALDQHIFSFVAVAEGRMIAHELLILLLPFPTTIP